MSIYCDGFRSAVSPRFVRVGGIGWWHIMQPASSVCALVFNHPQARYFAVGPIGDDQRADYAVRR